MALLRFYAPEEFGGTDSLQQNVFGCEGTEYTRHYEKTIVMYMNVNGRVYFSIIPPSHIPFPHSIK